MDNVSDPRTYNLTHVHEYSIPTKKVQPSSFLPLVIKGFSCIRPAIQNNMNAQYPKNPPLAINGFGRIGLSVLIMAIQDNVNVVAINEPNAKIEEIACWIKHAMMENKMYGYARLVSVKNDNCLDIYGKSIRVYNEKDPEKIKWKELQVEYVIEASGKFTEVETAKKHLAAGVKKVIISGPSKDAPMFIRGVNFDKYKKNMTVVSTASSTTDCAVPLLNIINQQYGVEDCQLTKNVIRVSFLDKHAIGNTKLTTPLKTTYEAKEVGIFIPELKGQVTDALVTSAVPIKWSFNILLNFSYYEFLRWKSDQRKRTGYIAEETNIFIPEILGDLINPELISRVGLPVVIDYSHLKLDIVLKKPVKLEELTCPKLWESEVISYVDEEEKDIVKLFNSFNSNTIVKSKNISVNFDKTITIGAETLNNRGYLKCLLDLYNHMVKVDQEKPPPMIS